MLHKSPNYLLNFESSAIGFSYIDQNLQQRLLRLLSLLVKAKRRKLISIVLFIYLFHVVGNAVIGLPLTVFNFAMAWYWNFRPVLWFAVILAILLNNASCQVGTMTPSCPMVELKIGISQQWSFYKEGRDVGLILILQLISEQNIYWFSFPSYNITCPHDEFCLYIYVCVYMCFCICGNLGIKFNK